MQVLQSRGTPETKGSPEQGLVTAILLCCLVYLVVLTIRLEIGNDAWPLFVDFIPLWISILLLFFVITEFAHNKLPEQAQMARRLVLTCGFAACFGLMALTVMLSLRHSGSQILWQAVLSPAWIVVLSLAAVLCFLAPGMLRAGLHATLIASAISIALLSLSLILVGLKLDHLIRKWLWTYTLLPVVLALSLQITVRASRTSTLDFVNRVLVLIGGVMAMRRLDRVIDCPWVLSFSPFVCVVLLDLYKLHR